MKTQIDAETMNCGLLLHPSAHTLSPVLHNTLAARMGINMVYTAFDVDRDDLETAVKGADAMGFVGLNISVPHKESVIPFLQGLDEEAKYLGAVNTLFRKPGEEGFFGANTDLGGLKRGFDETSVVIKGKEVIVIGAGGAARSVCMLLAREDAGHIYLLNRTLSRAEALAHDLKEATGYDRVTILPLSDYKKIPAPQRGKYLCCQCTNIGMYPKTYETPIDDQAFFEQIEGALDVIYRPVETKFLRMAREAGCYTDNGVMMLLYQGVRAFELWFHCEVPKDVIQDAHAEIMRNLTHKTSIVLIGFMGSGKSTVSRVLAERLQEQRMDSDTEIETRVNTTIQDIFAVRGEEAFRAIETRILREIAGEEREPFVLSTGGGTPMREENRALLHEIGTVVWLKTSPEEIYRRTRDDDSRPLLQTDDPMQTITEMEEDRAENYETAADFTVVTDGRTPEEIADEILAIIASRDAM